VATGPVGKKPQLLLLDPVFRLALLTINLIIEILWPDRKIRHDK